MACCSAATTPRAVRRWPPDLFAGVLRAGIRVWTETTLVRLTTDGAKVTGAVVEHDGREITVTARRGVVLAAGGFDHSMDMRWKFQSESLGEHASLGAETNTGDAIRIAQDVGAGIALMDQAWWFPAVAALPGAPAVMLAERSLPGSLIVDQTGRRFTNEAADYMSFGQRVLERERSGNPVDSMWIIFDQQYRNSYVFAANCFRACAFRRRGMTPGSPHRADDLADLARMIGGAESQFGAHVTRFNEMCRAGDDPDFSRGRQRLRPVLRRPDDHPQPEPAPARQRSVLRRENGAQSIWAPAVVCAPTSGRGCCARTAASIDGLYAIGNTAANAFGTTYPGAGATIAQGLVYGYIAARDAARRT